MWPKLIPEDNELLEPLGLSSADSRSSFVYFDIGSVLVDLDWDSFTDGCVELAQRINPQEVLHNHKWHGWQDWSTGRMGPYDFAVAFLKSLGCEGVTDADFDTNLLLDTKQVSARIVGPVRPQVVSLVKDLRRRGIGVGVLSNAVPWHETDVEATLPVKDLFDVVIFSQDVGCEKPDPKIYHIAHRAAARLVKERYGTALSAHGIYFVDDTPRNVRAARIEGWQAALVSLISDDLLQRFREGKIPAEDLAVLSTDSRNLVFGTAAAARVIAALGAASVAKA